jgi:hypothetical protein
VQLSFIYNTFAYLSKPLVEFLERYRAKDRKGRICTFMNGDTRAMVERHAETLNKISILATVAETPIQFWTQGYQRPTGAILRRLKSMSYGKVSGTVGPLFSITLSELRPEPPRPRGLDTPEGSKNGPGGFCHHGRNRRGRRSTVARAFCCVTHGRYSDRAGCGFARGHVYLDRTGALTAGASVWRLGVPPSRRLS